MSTALVNNHTRPSEVARPQTDQPTTYVPRCDIWYGADEIMLFSDLPGVGPENLDIRFENGMLTIHGKVSPRYGGVQFLAGEYGIGDFQRTFTIGEIVDVDRISAEMRDGVLILHLPKSERVKPRRIEVNVK